MNCKSYIPGYYTTRGLNKDGGNNWPIHYDNKSVNGHRHSNCMFSSLNGYSEYDKEMLKRTMLEHEVIFRKQVYELHRLYGIQKDLMVEFQKNGLYRFSAWTVKSKTSLSSSEAQSQVTGRIWQIYNQPAMSSSQSRETTTVTNTNVSPISTPQSCFGALEIGALGRDGESNAGFRASTKRMLDLQVPADTYIDTKCAEKSEKEEIAGLSSVTTAPYSRKCNGDPDNEVKLTLANVSNVNGGVHKYDSHRKDSLFHRLADLNEPFEETSLVGTAYSSPSQQLDANHRPNGSLRSTNLWLQISSSKNRDCDESDLLPKVKKELSQACFHFLGEAGKSKFDLSLDSGKEKCSMSFDPIQMSQIKANDILLNDLNKAEKIFVQKKDNSLEIPRKRSSSTVSDNHEKLASLNIDDPALPSLPPWMKPSGGEKQSSAQLEATSSFDKSSGFCGRFQFCSDVRPSHLENGKFSHQSGFSHGFLRDSCSQSRPDVSYSNLNLGPRESCSFDIRDGVTAGEELSPELPWLKNKPNFDESLNLNRLSSSVNLCFSASGLGDEGAVEIETPLPSCNLEEFQSKPHGSEEKTQRNEVSVSSTREEIIGLAVLEKIQPNPLNTEKELSGEDSRSFRNHIDLNREVTIIDEPNLSNMSTESPVFLPSQASDTLSSSKAFPLMDMEENSTPESSQDVLVKEAAENMITLSIDKFEHLDDDPSHLSAGPPCSILHWFADMALSNAHMKISDVEMDLFELMTLRLEETKPEETWCSPRETETAKDDEKSRAFLLFKKPRRGKARKRRQRRDFQKDTLPGLATLSRKEIAGDLQLIGGLLKESGCHWEASTGGRRNGGRNSTPVKEKRKQLARKATFAVTKEHSRPQNTLFLVSKSGNNPEFEVDRPSMVGWGKTTRRCRRRRCHPPQSIATALT